jgi:hypothetical protein
MTQTSPVTEYLAAIGRQGGKSCSAAKRAAARRNGMAPKCLYEIVAYHAGSWRSDMVGSPNVFRSARGAEQAIRELRALGGEWADAEYGVRKRKQTV